MAIADVILWNYPFYQNKKFCSLKTFFFNPKRFLLWGLEKWFSRWNACHANIRKWVSTPKSQFKNQACWCMLKTPNPGDVDTDECWELSRWLVLLPRWASGPVRESVLKSKVESYWGRHLHWPQQGCSSVAPMSAPASRFLPVVPARLPLRMNWDMKAYMK